MTGGAGGSLPRRARFEDLPGIVAVYASDEAGGHGDGWSAERAPAYERAMRAILANPATRLYVAVDGEAALENGRGISAGGGQVVGVLQLHLQTGLTGGGRTRARLTGVCVLAGRRGAGIGAALVRHAIAEAAAAGAGLVDLTSNSQRADAHRFYERLGFHRGHDGFSLPLR